MSVAAALARELFAPLGPLRVKRMFGVQGLWRDDAMFALIADDILYLKADAALAARLEAAGSEPFRFARRDRVVETSFWRLPDSALDDPDEALDWARQALEPARAAAAKRK